MEKLTEYLQSLLSSCSDELRLEPDKNPYLVAADRTTDVANIPMAGTQISTMVFPLIPPEAKSALPNSPEIEFVHPHSLGNFNFHVQKSPAGFIVTIRPLMDDTGESAAIPKPQLEVAADNPVEFAPANVEPEDFLAPRDEPAPEFSYVPDEPSSSYDLKTNESAEATSLPDPLMDENVSAPAYESSKSSTEIEVISPYDPEYQTVFSDTATYEPPGRRDDFELEAFAPPALETVTPTDTFVSQPEIFAPPAESVYSPTPEAAFVPSQADAASASKMDVLFNKMSELGASDLHLSVSMPPMIRKDGKMDRLQAGDEALTADKMRELLTSIMPARNQEEFAARSDTDFAYEIPGLARFRCNIFMDRKGMGGVFRIIPSKILTAEQLGLSSAILGLCDLSKGLVVVTGPTGSGKSTTLCAMVNHINARREDHIITIEDPIEFVHDNQKCLVNQREVHNHTDSFKDALRAALREDPDIVLVGEMRDLETISIAIETAETGHLVFGTLHTTTAPSTVDRIIDQFPADRQQQIRVMLSESLKGVIAQTLLPKKGGGRVAALEVLIVTPAISNLIREGKTFQIPSAMQTGRNHGMVMLNDALFEHVQNGTVEPMDAYIKAVDKTGFETMLTRAGISL